MRKKYISAMFGLAMTATLLVGSTLSVSAKSEDSSEIHVVRSSVTSFDPWKAMIILMFIISYMISL